MAKGRTVNSNTKVVDTKDAVPDKHGARYPSFGMSILLIGICGLRDDDVYVLCSNGVYAMCGYVDRAQGIELLASYMEYDKGLSVGFESE